MTLCEHYSVSLRKLLVAVRAASIRPEHLANRVQLAGIVGLRGAVQALRAASSTICCRNVCVNGESEPLLRVRIAI